MDPDAFFQILVLHLFAVFGFAVSLIGAGIVVSHMVQRRKRSFVNIVVSSPFAVMAIALHATATDGFTRVGDQAFISAWRLLPAHLSMGWLLGLVGAPLIWLAVAVIGAGLAPPRFAQKRERQAPSVPPLTVGKAMRVVVPTVLVLVAYASLFVLAAHSP